MADLPGRALAQELAAASREDSRATPIEDVVAAAHSPGLDGDAVHRAPLDQPRPAWEGDASVARRGTAGYSIERAEADDAGLPEGRVPGL